jgi:hypothetical protein
MDIFELKEYIRDNKEIPAIELEKHSFHANPDIRWYVLQHPNATPEIHKRLLKDKDLIVRCDVFLYAALEVFEDLWDQLTEIRAIFQLCKNPNLDRRYILKLYSHYRRTLSHREFHRVALSFVENPSTPSWMRQVLFTTYPGLRHLI